MAEHQDELRTKLLDIMRDRVSKICQRIEVSLTWEGQGVGEAWRLEAPPVWLTAVRHAVLGGLGYRLGCAGRQPGREIASGRHAAQQADDGPGQRHDHAAQGARSLLPA